MAWHIAVEYLILKSKVAQPTQVFGLGSDISFPLQYFCCKLDHDVDLLHSC